MLRLSINLQSVKCRCICLYFPTVVHPRLSQDLTPLNASMDKSFERFSIFLTELKMEHRDGKLKSDRLTQLLVSDRYTYGYQQLHIYNGFVFVMVYICDLMIVISHACTYITYIYRHLKDQTWLNLGFCLALLVHDWWKP